MYQEDRCDIKVKRSETPHSKIDFNQGKVHMDHDKQDRINLLSTSR